MATKTKLNFKGIPKKLIEEWEQTFLHFDLSMNGSDWIYTVFFSYYHNRGIAKQYAEHKDECTTAAKLCKLFLKNNGYPTLTSARKFLHELKIYNI